MRSLIPFVQELSDDLKIVGPIFGPSGICYNLIPTEDLERSATLPFIFNTSLVLKEDSLNSKSLY